MGRQIVGTVASQIPRSYALSVLKMALGGGVSSRLFQRLHEREALVYSVGNLLAVIGFGVARGVLVTDHRKTGGVELT
jgi:predicted Zn-dependent peptidase